VHVSAMAFDPVADAAEAGVDAAARVRGLPPLRSRALDRAPRERNVPGRSAGMAGAARRLSTETRTSTGRSRRMFAEAIFGRYAMHAHAARGCAYLAARCCSVLVHGGDAEARRQHARRPAARTFSRPGELVPLAKHESASHARGRLDHEAFVLVLDRSLEVFEMQGDLALAYAKLHTELERRLRRAFS
jgi:hypothetical protein